MRGIERTFGVCRQTLSAWLKKRRSSSPLETTLKPVDPRKTPVLEADEVWSFVFRVVVNLKVIMNHSCAIVIAGSETMVVSLSSWFLLVA